MNKGRSFATFPANVLLLTVLLHLAAARRGFVARKAATQQGRSRKLGLGQKLTQLWHRGAFVTENDLPFPRRKDLRHNARGYVTAHNRADNGFDDSLAQGRVIAIHATVLHGEPWPQAAS
jgi:hypothetical protein